MSPVGKGPARKYSGLTCPATACLPVLLRISLMNLDENLETAHGAENTYFKVSLAESIGL